MTQCGVYFVPIKNNNYYDTHNLHALIGNPIRVLRLIIPTRRLRTFTVNNFKTY